MKKIDKNSIAGLIDKTLAVYQADASRVIADYRAERQYTADYEGRQILELLQNADDAETDNILIEINTSNNTLSISNNGVPFSLEGVKSLMLANMSPKNKKEYIGNKGLGFRSILNWVTKVDVITEDAILEFSPSFAKENYTKIRDLNHDLLTEVENDTNLSNGEIPFAILAIPAIQEVVERNDWVTTIRLHYKENEQESIKNQLASISEETLLFLKHTKQIRVKANYEQERVYQKTVLSADKIQVNEKIWNVHHSGEKAFSEEKMYSFQIAWQDDLNDKDAVFYTYFPTDVKTHLPCLIHATFDLNSSRKEINPTNENLHILAEIASVLRDIALNRFDTEISSWKPYQFLYPISKSDNNVLKNFYQSLENLRKTSPIYPSTDGSYYNKEEIIDYGIAFSNWVENNELGSHFNQLLKPFNEEIEHSVKGLYFLHRYSPEKLFEILSNANAELNDFTQRAQLIKLLIDNRFKNLHDSTIRLPLLIDRETKEPTNNQLFTIRRDDNSTITPPDYVKGMSFIDTDFYNILTTVFSKEIENARNEKENVSRPLKRVIDRVVNIGSNDIIDVIRFVIKETENQLLQTESDGKDLVKSLIDFLYQIFLKNTERKGVLPITIPLINRSKQVVNAEDLFFGKEYDDGEFTELIFEGIYFDKDYLIGNDYWQLEFDNTEDSIAFFTWLGVNRFLKFQKDTNEITPPALYQAFVFKSRPDIQKTYHYFRGTKIADESLIQKLSKEKLLVLLTKDSFLKNQLSENHSDTYKYKYGSGYPKLLNSFPSFIEFQITSKVNFSDYIINNELGLDQLFKSVEFSGDLFTKFKVYEGEVKALLEKFGAIKSLDHISLKDFYRLFEQQEILFPEGRGSSNFYKRFLEICTKSKAISENKNDFDFTDFKCFARKGGRKESPLELKNVSEIYYSDNNLVPKDVLDKFWILYLPNRLGERNVKKYFGVNLISDVLEKIKIDNREPSEHDLKFNSHIQKLKPYFLYYRLLSIKDKNVKNEAINLTKNIDIKLVSSCAYHFASDETFYLQKNHFIKIAGTFYVNNASSLETLIDDIEFCDTVAEIFGTHYKVKEFHSRYRSIFNANIKDTEYIIRSDEGEELLAEAKQTLGISSNEITFWRRLFDFRSEEFSEEISDQEELGKILLKYLEYSLPTDYHLVDFSNLSKKETIGFLKAVSSKFGLEVSQLITWETDGFYGFYDEALRDLTRDNHKRFKRLMWNQLEATKSISEQKKFLPLLFEFNSIVDQDFVKNEIKRNALNATWDIDRYFFNLIEKKFDLKDFSAQSNLPDPTNLYPNILSEYKIDEDQFPIEWKGLLYFKDNEQSLRDYLDEMDKSKQDQIEEVLDTSSVGNLYVGKSEKLNMRVFSNPVNSGWSHGMKDVVKNKRAGKRAEMLVYNTLVSEHGVDHVQWMSSFSETSLDKADSYHFDIAYKIDNTWKYLEVKSFNGTYFHLSREEKSFGMKYPNKYEVALVSGTDIFIFKELFKNDINFNDNPYYKATPSDYIISLKIDHPKN